MRERKITVNVVDFARGAYQAQLEHLKDSGHPVEHVHEMRKALLAFFQEHRVCPQVASCTLLGALVDVSVEAERIAKASWN